VADSSSKNFKNKAEDTKLKADNKKAEEKVNVKQNKAVKEKSVEVKPSNKTQKKQTQDNQRQDSVNYSNYAIVKKGHAQFVLHEGELLEIPRINVEEGKEYVFDEVLAIFKDGKSYIGTPIVKDAKVKVFVIKQVKGKKARGFKYKAKSRYRKQWGYRNPKTRIRVLSISV